MRQMTKTTGKTEWYTPAKYIEAARRVLGEIDLDPASCEMAQRTVGARHWYGIEDDGLGCEWWGTVFLNPPYARSVVDAFIERLRLYWKADWIDAYITLTNDCMDTAWAHQLLRMSDAVCFVRGRIKFDTPSGGGQAAAQRSDVLLCRAGCRGFPARVREVWDCG